MLFIVIDVTESLSHVLNYFGVSEDDAPTVRTINMDTGKKYAIDSEDLTANSLQQLCQEVVDGTAKVLQTHTHTHVLHSVRQEHQRELTGRPAQAVKQLMY